MGPTDPALLAQMRILAEQAADIALTKHERPLPEAKVEIPAPMKWAAGIVSAVMTAGVVALFLWLVTTVNAMQQTLVRIDERQQSQNGNLDGRFDDVDRRLKRLENARSMAGDER